MTAFHFQNWESVQIFLLLQQVVIESCAEVVGVRMWHEKYQVCDSIVPSFINRSQAKKILGNGKSINFLREVCKDFSPLQDREILFQDPTKQIWGTLILIYIRFEILSGVCCVIILFLVEAFFDMEEVGPLRLQRFICWWWTLLTKKHPEE